LMGIGRHCNKVGEEHSVHISLVRFCYSCNSSMTQVLPFDVQSEVNLFKSNGGVKRPGREADNTTFTYYRD
jgi:hypothetical protein